MKNSLYWELLPLVLIAFCFLGCGELDEDDSNSDYDPGNNSIYVGGVGGSQPIVREDNPEEQPNIEEVLAEIEAIIVELEALLAENNENVPEDVPLVQDVESPKMTEANIAPGAQNVTLASVIWIKFDEPIDTADVTLQIKNGDIVETRVIFRNETIEIRRVGRGKDFHLKPLTTYIVKGTVSDAAGNETEVEMTFTTGENIF